MSQHGVNTNEKEVNQQVTFSPSGAPYRVVVTGGEGTLRVEDYPSHQVDNNIECATRLVDSGFTVNGYRSGSTCQLHYWNNSNEYFPKKELTLKDYLRKVCCCPAKQVSARPGILGFSGNTKTQQPGYYCNSPDVGSGMYQGGVTSPYTSSPASMRYAPSSHRGGYN